MFRIIPIAIFLTFCISCLEKTAPTQSTSPAIPTLWSWQFDSTSLGCGNFLAYSFNDSRKVAIIASANACAFSLSTNVSQFNLSTSDSFFQVSVRVYNQDPTSKTSYFCNDAILVDSFPLVLLETWHATSGIVHISSDTTSQCPPQMFNPYHVNIVIDSLILQKDGNTDKVFAPRFEFKNVLVGWIVG
jgi:hypothetical protein